jgi:hypothetical protein
VAQTVLDFAGLHQGQPALIMGYGPSIGASLRMPRAQHDDARKIDSTHVLNQADMEWWSDRCITIAINRAYLFSGVKTDYQISADKIWTAMTENNRWPDLKKNHDRLRTEFRKWVNEDPSRHGAGLTVEDYLWHVKPEWVHFELWSYYMLCSKHAPFTRFVNLATASTCPYPHVKFKQSGRQPVWGNAQDGGLLCAGNSLHLALHLAIVMMCDPIFLIGCDMTPPDPKTRPTEKGAVYHLPSISKGFQMLKKAADGNTHIWNLNPNSHLTIFPRITPAKGKEYLRKCKNPAQKSPKHS